MTTYLFYFQVPQTLSALVWHHLLISTTSSKGRLKYLMTLAGDPETTESGQPPEDRLASKQQLCEKNEPSSQWLSEKHKHACHRAFVHGPNLVFD